MQFFAKCYLIEIFKHEFQKVRTIGDKISKMWSPLGTFKFGDKFLKVGTVPTKWGRLVALIKSSKICEKAYLKDRDSGNMAY